MLQLRGFGMADQMLVNGKGEKRVAVVMKVQDEKGKLDAFVLGLKPDKVEEFKALFSILSGVIEPVGFNDTVALLIDTYLATDQGLIVAPKSGILTF